MIANLDTLEHVRDRQPQRELPELLWELSKHFAGRVIPRGPDGQPYLERYYIGSDNDVAGAFLHRFRASDDVGELHNHPWSWSMSFILSGRYREIRAEAAISERSASRVFVGAWQERILGPGAVNRLEAHDFHRVELLDDQVWTLFVHGPRVQSWGFVPERFGEWHELRVINERTFTAREAVTR